MTGGVGLARGEAMTAEILLALGASLFTASASVAQRVAAAPAPGELSFSWRLIPFLLRRPAWFLGVVCMIGAFLLQLAALHIGSLMLVQPMIAAEILFVYGYLAFRNYRSVRLRDWLSALGMAGGLAAFLTLASPTGGKAHGTGSVWLLTAGVILVAALLVALAAVVPIRGHPPTPSRKAAGLATAAAIMWGFIAAVIKELSTHLSGGFVGVFSTWSPYVIVGAGILAMYLVSNAFHAGPLAASQPALTIVDPLVASLLGVTIFGERVRHQPPELAGELLALAVLVGSVVMMSRSPLIRALEDPGVVSSANYPSEAASGVFGREGAVSRPQEGIEGEKAGTSHRHEPHDGPPAQAGAAGDQRRGTRALARED